MTLRYHDRIHTDTLRLRLLLTNHCQQKCPHCLNEYMCKPINKQSALFMNTSVFEQIVTAYDTVLREGILTEQGLMKPRIYFSGGEPTLHPDFSNMVTYVKDKNIGEITLCTNGHNWHMHMIEGTYDKIDHLHFSFGFLQSTLVLNHFIPIWENLRSWREIHDKKNIVFSVVTNADPDFERILIDMLQYQKDTNNGFTLKLWGDLRFGQDHFVNKRYAALLTAYPELVHRGPVQHPVNRGLGCDECNNTCPTLKALWVRPDNTCSPCPQSKEWDYLIDTTTSDMEREMQYPIRKALIFHFTYAKKGVAMQWRSDDGVNHSLTKNDIVLTVRKAYGQGIVVIRCSDGKERKFAHPDDDVTVEQLKEFAIQKMEEITKSTVWTAKEREALERLRETASNPRQNIFGNPFADLFGGGFGEPPYGK